MRRYHITMRVRKQGAIGFFGDRHSVEVEAADEETARKLAIIKANYDGREVHNISFIVIM
jgi:hypothetical protein